MVWNGYGWKLILINNFGIFLPTNNWNNVLSIPENWLSLYHLHSGHIYFLQFLFMGLPRVKCLNPKQQHTNYLEHGRILQQMLCRVMQNFCYTINNERQHIIFGAAIKFCSNIFVIFNFLLNLGILPYPTIYIPFIFI